MYIQVAVNKSAPLFVPALVAIIQCRSKDDAGIFTVITLILHYIAYICDLFTKTDFGPSE
jgi:hypothetical protein